LDSANERGYQPAFVQLLVSEGHRVLHSTRHAPIEFGKDVISIAPDGAPCAYQLKGNPGGRLTHRQFREIQPQLQELVTQAIPYAGLPDVQHRSYLVTNGFVDEEVQRAIQDLNRTWERNGYGAEALTVLERGYFLERANALGTSLWPFGVADLGALVDLLSHRGDDMLPLLKMHKLLSTMYRLAGPDSPPGGRELERLVTSAALMVAVATRNFGVSANHFAVASAWVLFSTYTVAACTRAGVSSEGPIAESLSAARQAVFEEIAALIDEAAARRSTLVEGIAWADTEFYPARQGLLNGIASTYWLWCRRDNLAPANLPSVETFLPREFSTRALWGEAALPQLLAHYWYISRRDASFGPERQLARLLATIIRCQLGQEEAEFLASPYYSIGDVVRHRHAGFLGTANDPFDAMSFRGASYFAEALLHLVVRTNLKQHCKTLWPDFTKLNLRWFEVAEPWQFCTIHTEDGLACTRLVPPTGEWAALQEAAAAHDTPKVPELLRADPILLLLFVMMVPHRATPNVIRFLGREFSDIWFLPLRCSAPNTAGR
jgi:hypothetical protein